MLQRLDSSAIEAHILILEKVLNCRYDLIIGPIYCFPGRCFLCFVFVFSFFFQIATLCQIRIWRVINQIKDTAIATTDLCAGALSW